MVVLLVALFYHRGRALNLEPGGTVMAYQLQSTVANVARRIAVAAVDLLFPKRCVGCGDEGSFLCQRCSEELPMLEPPYCFLCARPERLVLGLCSRCRGRPLEIDGIRSPYRMEGAVREAVHALKYQGVRALAPTLGGLLADYVSRNPMPVDAIVPVPLHPRRERSRGYNQSTLLAQAMGEALDVPVETSALRRLRQTPPQARSVGEDERRINVSGAFEAEAGQVRGRRIVVIDDVCTTGATLESCAIALRSAGAASVWGLTLALET